MTINPEIVHRLEHPLAGFFIASALCVYHPMVLRLGRRLLQPYFREPLACGDTMKQFRMLGSELATISLAAMLKATLDSASDLSHAIDRVARTSGLEMTWVFYAWFAVLYMVGVFTPSVFVRYALLERKRGEKESRKQWALFTWRWTLVSWLLGFVNLHIALKFMVR